MLVHSCKQASFEESHCSRKDTRLHPAPRLKRLFADPTGLPHEKCRVPRGWGVVEDFVITI